MARPLAAAVFDVDDTLYPEIDFVRGGLHAAARALGVPEAAAVLLEILEREGPFHLFDRGLEHLGIPRTPERIALLVGAFRAHQAPLEPFAGVRPMLARLRAAGVRLALVTDGYLDVQRHKVAALGLEPAVDLVVFTADVDGRRMLKPDIGAFRHVQERLGLEGDLLAMVGDRPDKDFPGPDALGWRTLRARHPGCFHRDAPDPGPGRPEVLSIDAMERRLMAWAEGRELPG
jgi:putative hydrolase of the HAD superfamily